MSTKSFPAPFIFVNCTNMSAQPIREGPCAKFKFRPCSGRALKNRRAGCPSRWRRDARRYGFVRRQGLAELAPPERYRFRFGERLRPGLNDHSPLVRARSCAAELPDQIRAGVRDNDKINDQACGDPRRE